MQGKRRVLAVVPLPDWTGGVTSAIDPTTHREYLMPTETNPQSIFPGLGIAPSFCEITESCVGDPKSTTY
jgi:hypothetical protein